MMAKVDTKNQMLRIIKSMENAKMRWYILAGRNWMSIASGVSTCIKVSKSVGFTQNFHGHKVRVFAIKTYFSDWVSKRQSKQHQMLPKGADGAVDVWHKASCKEG